MTDRTNTTPNPNTHLYHLYDLADKINAFKQEQRRLYDNNIPYEQYRDVPFYTLYCGEPKVYSSLNIPLVVHQLYPNPLGDVLYYGCCYVIKCRPLPNILDLDNRQIFEGINGTLFVYRYVPSYPAHIIDEALVAPPRIEFAESVSQYEIYCKAAEVLVSQMADKIALEDILVKMSLINRIAELQNQAYAQGREFSSSMHYDMSKLEPDETTLEN